MRLGNGLAIAGLMATAPAMAQDRLAMPVQSGVRPSALPGAVSTSTIRLNPNLRLRVGVADGGTAPATRVQPRLSGSMIDFYPVEGTGFHLSAGTKLFADRDLNIEGNRAGRGLLTTARRRDGAPQFGKRRATPALTMGYTGNVGDDTSVGVEMGALKGRGFATVDDMAKSAHGGRGSVNPMLNLVVGRRF